MAHGMVRYRWGCVGICAYKTDQFTRIRTRWHTNKEHTQTGDLIRVKWECAVWQRGLG